MNKLNVFKCLVFKRIIYQSKIYYTDQCCYYGENLFHLCSTTLPSLIGRRYNSCRWEIFLDFSHPYTDRLRLRWFFSKVRDCPPAIHPHSIIREGRPLIFPILSGQKVDKNGLTFVNRV